MYTIALLPDGIFADFVVFNNIHPSKLLVAGAKPTQNQRVPGAQTLDHEWGALD